MSATSFTELAANEPMHHRPPIRGSRLLKNVVLYLLLTIAAGAVVAPLLWMIVTSLRPADEVLKGKGGWIPSRLTISNYADAFAAVPLARYFLNSLFVASIVVASNLFLCSLTGYALAKFEFRANRAVFLLILSTMMIPAQMMFIPLFLVVRSLGIVDSYLALIIPAAMNPFGVFLMRQAMQGVPNDLIDSARIDGARELAIFLRIAWPLTLPTQAALAIFTFLWSWNGFLWPLIVIRSPELFTLPIGLTAFQDLHGTDYHLLLAGLTFSVAPQLVLFLIFQRQFINGVTMAGLKG
ncbi:MAG: carbohydrate ABC transporter permease [Thermomicrobiales bacterium]